MKQVLFTNLLSNALNFSLSPGDHPWSRWNAATPRVYGAVEVTWCPHSRSTSERDNLQAVSTPKTRQRRDRPRLSYLQGDHRGRTEGRSASKMPPFRRKPFLVQDTEKKGKETGGRSMKTTTSL